jgi:hypothetical protein
MKFYDVSVNQSVLTEANRGLTSYIVKLAYSTKLAEEFFWCGLAKLLLSFAHSFPIYYSLNNEIDYMISTAYARTQVDVNVRVLVKARNELSVITTCIIAYKAVELLGYFEFVEYVKYNRSLGSLYIVSVEVAEGN